MKSFMGFLLVLVFAIGLLFPLPGCSTIGKLTPAPPAGAEDSFLWQHNFMPFGPSVVRGAFYVLATVAPSSHDILLEAFNTARSALQAGSLTGGLKSLADVLAVNLDNPFIGLAARGAVDVLNAVVVLPQTVLDPADKAILLGLLDNLVADLGTAKSAPMSLQKPIILKAPRR